MFIKLSPFSYIYLVPKPIDTSTISHPTVHARQCYISEPPKIVFLLHCKVSGVTIKMIAICYTPSCCSTCQNFMAHVHMPRGHCRHVPSLKAPLVRWLLYTKKINVKRSDYFFKPWWKKLLLFFEKGESKDKVGQKRKHHWS